MLHESGDGQGGAAAATGGTATGGAAGAAITGTAGVGHGGTGATAAGGGSKAGGAVGSTTSVNRNTYQGVTDKEVTVVFAYMHETCGQDPSAFINQLGPPGNPDASIQAALTPSF